MGSSTVHLLHRQIEKSSSVSMLIIYQAIFKILLKNENCSKFIMKVMLRKSLVLKIKKTQTKTFMALKHDFLEIKHTKFFLLLHNPLPIHHNFRNWCQIFYTRSGLYKIHALPISFFWLIVSMEISVT